MKKIKINNPDSSLFSHVMKDDNLDPSGVRPTEESVASLPHPVPLRLSKKSYFLLHFVRVELPRNIHNEERGRPDIFIKVAKRPCRKPAHRSSPKASHLWQLPTLTSKNALARSPHSSNYKWFLVKMSVSPLRICQSNTTTRSGRKHRAPWNKSYRTQWWQMKCDARSSRRFQMKLFVALFFFFGWEEGAINMLTE